MTRTFENFFFSFFTVNSIQSTDKKKWIFTQKNVRIKKYFQGLKKIKY
jgi:hypothetical protein